MSKSNDKDNFKLVGQNRRAHYDYDIKEKFEAGIMLTGTEVKALRNGNVSLQEGFISPNNGELYLLGVTIPHYSFASAHLNHEPRRRRKILLHAREIRKVLGKLDQKGFTLVPISMYFNHRGILKISLGLGTGKKTEDKRETIKQRDWNRNKARILKGEYS